MQVQIKDHFAEVAQRDPAGIALYHDDAGYSWGELWQAAQAVHALLRDAGVPQGAAVGWMARNDPAAVAAALAIFSGGWFLSPFNPNDPVGKRADDLARLRPAVLIDRVGGFEDGVEAALRAYGGIAVEIGLRPELAVRLRPGFARIGPGPFRDNSAGAVMERVSSGTTGDPKRIPVTAELMRKSMELALGPKAGAASGKPLAPQIITVPLAHATGLWNVATALYSGRPVIVQERFRAESWVAAVKRHRIKVATLVPSMIRMVLDYDPPREDLASLICVRSGTAPLDPALQHAFEERFGVPVLIDYGASEFMGGIAGWTLDDYKALREAKTGSVGRIRGDVEVRVLDQDSGEVLGPGEVGILSLKSKRFGPDWIATTDLASYDEDRFLFIHGRSDEAIIRGGFKVLPEKVAAVLRGHPAVRDACVLGVKDERLGQVPLAVIEQVPGTGADAAGLAAYARQHIPAYEVPAFFEFVAELPRTVSFKVARPALRALFADRYGF